MSLKGLIENAVESTPDTKSLISELPEEDREKVEQLKKELAFLERFKGLERPQDVFAEASPSAAKQLAWEAEFGRTSGDRRKAAELILSWELGKPVNRQVSMNMSPSDFGDEELTSKVLDLMAELGLKGDVNRAKLIIESTSAREALPDARRLEGGEGSEPFTEPETQSGDAGAIR